MSQRRMFSLQIVDTDAFLEMPATSQLLYFHLAMRADDEGFIGNPKKIMRMIGASDDDLKVLITKRFVLIFQSGIVVIKHWRIHNYISKDRFHETRYLEEKGSIKVKDNGSYTECIQNVDKMETEVRLGKVRLGKDREEGDGSPTPRQAFLEFLKSQESEIKELVEARGLPERFIRGEVKKFVDYWTEPTANGKRQRWELQKTFDYRRRLATWLLKADEWSKDAPEKVIKF